MAILRILNESEERLRKVSRRVDKIDRRVLTLLDDMKETLARANGAGLAAPQVGVLRRLFVIAEEDGSFLELINPEIIASSGLQEEVEGCLSSPGKFALTRRPAEVTLRALDRAGNTAEYTRSGLYARAFCHESDHLDGILCYDKCVKILSDEEVGEMMRKAEEKRDR